MHMIARAKPDDAAALTEIAFAAKRHWGYPQDWMESWREVLTIRPEFIRDHEIYKAVVDDRAIGFYALDRKSVRLELAHLWVSPDAMGRGVGRCLFLHALERAREAGFRELEIESDPNAEGFYERMGAHRIGTNTRLWEGQARELPVLVCEIDAAARLSGAAGGVEKII
jgi:GNAT superfamily N-acetyltransferase